MIAVLFMRGAGIFGSGGDLSKYFHQLRRKVCLSRSALGRKIRGRTLLSGGCLGLILTVVAMGDHNAMDWGQGVQLKVLKEEVRLTPPRFRNMVSPTFWAFVRRGLRRRPLGCHGPEVC